MAALSRKLWLVGLLGLVASALAFSACGGDDEGVGQDAEGVTDTGGADTQTPEEGAGGDRNVTAPLDEQNGSGQSGTATLSALGEGKTRVVIQLANAPDEAQPAHIHEGTCQDLAESPKYPLKSLEHGHSDSEVDASLDSLQAEEFAINVHKSEKDIGTYVACGDLSGGGGAGG